MDKTDFKQTLAKAPKNKHEQRAKLLVSVALRAHDTPEEALRWAQTRAGKTPGADTIIEHLKEMEKNAKVFHIAQKHAQRKIVKKPQQFDDLSISF